MHQYKVITAGTDLKIAKKALVLLHGRGATAEDILGLGKVLNVEGYTLIAPQATNYTWYPYSFLSPVEQNEPWLSSALALISSVVDEILKAGISHENMFFAGFAQGACRTLAVATRNAKKWGGVAAFTGGLIGEKIDMANYKGDFQGMPVFIGSSDPDPHVPVSRVRESAQILEAMHADVTEKIYPNMGHTITEDELLFANRLIFE
jgi:phospholipase/carboxylesterase